MASGTDSGSDMPATAEPTVEQRVRDNLALARSIARRFYYPGGEPLDELIQVANLGLFLAARRFDPNRGVNFSTYATSCIAGEIKRHYRDRCWSLHVPRVLKDGKGTELEQEWARGARYPLSLDIPLTSDEDNLTLGDTLSDPDDHYACVDARLSRLEAMRLLTERERRILYLYYYEDMPQREIAQHVGCSQMHVSRILRDIRRRLDLPQADTRTRAAA